MTAPAPPPPNYYYPPPQSVRSVSPPRHERMERVEESSHIDGPLTVLVPRKDHPRSEREIQNEIRELELERRTLRTERDRDSDYEIIEKKDRNVVRIEKDRKGRLALVRSTH